jgi:uncharacterized membrane protein
MPRSLLQKLALALFLVYCALFPGSTSTVALDAVPAWGEWMGGALLVLQGLAVICWMLGRYGGRGAVAVAGALLLAWSVEHFGETTGLPFGRYRYTEMLQPQLLGIVPLPITLAWLMSAFGSWQLARLTLGHDVPLRDPRVLALTGVLIVVLDLQIETVATLVNPYWVWIDGGPYYGVPPLNFAAWWVVGALMALIVALALGDEARVREGRSALSGEAKDPTEGRANPRSTGGQWFAVSGRWSVVAEHIPALLYILSSLMFTVVNFARGYPLAGLVGLVFLAVAAAIGFRGASASARAIHRRAG